MRQTGNAPVLVASRTRANPKIVRYSLEKKENALQAGEGGQVWFELASGSSSRADPRNQPSPKTVFKNRLSAPVC